MKNVFILSLSMIAVTYGRAQIFRPEAASGALLGGVAGAIIGNNSGSLRHNGWAGAAIGASAGLLIGNAVGEANDRASQVPTPYWYRNRGYESPYSSVYVESPGSYYYTSSRPNYVGVGTVLGGITGAIIGNNSGHRTWQGAAIGAGAGLLLGSIAEQSARDRELYVSPQYVVREAPVASATVQPRAPSTVYAPSATETYASSGASVMSGANALFGR